MLRKVYPTKSNLKWKCQICGTTNEGNNVCKYCERGRYVPSIATKTNYNGEINFGEHLPIRKVSRL